MRERSDFGSRPGEEFTRAIIKATSGALLSPATATPDNWQSGHQYHQRQQKNAMVRGYDMNASGSLKTRQVHTYRHRRRFDADLGC